MITENNCSILFAGLSDLIFIDEKGMEYVVNTERLGIGTHDMILFSRRISPVCGTQKLSAKDRALIVSKILNLTKNIKWFVV